MVVTKITAQQRNQNRVNVFIDTHYALSLTLDQLLAEKLKIGTVLSDADVKKLLKLSEDGKLRARALEWVLLRPRSAKELKTYLMKKQADASLMQSIMDEFARKGYQDDESFARWWVDNRVRKNKSNIAIQSELTQKGIARSIADAALSQSGTQKERLRALVIQKKGVAKYKSDPTKFKRFLLGKGFRYSDIDEVLGDAIDADDGND